MAKTMPWERTDKPETFTEQQLQKKLEETQRLLQAPHLSARAWFAMHAPPPPSWWKVRTATELAMWAWTWADAMLATEKEQTTPESAAQRRV